MDSAIEEFLRYDAPVQLGNRVTTAAVVLDGVALPAGTTLTLCIGAANRDPAVFREPDALDLARTPNPHLAFGGGIHTCAGLHVARLEARIAIGRLLARLPRLQLAGEAERGQRARFRGFNHLPLSTH
jgi:cytochrome P450